MVKVIFIDAGGAQYQVECPEGTTVMEAAIMNEVPTIVGFCGGMCACATCHCYPDDTWIPKLPPPDDDEKATLAHALDRKPTSRLGCQIRLSSALSGLVIRLPERQCAAC